MAKNVLIIGATGGIGGAAAAAFAGRGWDVTAMHREPGSALAGLLAGGGSWASDAKWVRGDAMQEADVTRAAEGMDVIVHGANPPGYKKWKKLAIPMLANAIEAARQSGARLIFPGNVYNFGPDSWPLLSEGLPQKPKTSRGKIRVRMGPALETLQEMEGALDFAFIDADKANYIHYFEKILPRLRPGGWIAADNTLWSGAVLDDPADQDEDTRTLAAFSRHVAADARVDQVLLTVRDGITLIWKR